MAVSHISTIEATVVEGLGVPRGVAYLTPAALTALGCSTDAIIQITGGRTTVARVRPWTPDVMLTEPQGDGYAITMDSLTRQNAQASLGETVQVTAVAAPDAISIALTPLGDVGNLKETEIRYVAQALRNLAVVAGDIVRIPGIGLKVREFQVFSTNPASAVVLVGGTVIRLQVDNVPARSREKVITYEAIGGLGQELQHIRELIELPLKHPAIFDRLGIEAPKGVLLYGAPGTGKTLIARAVAHEANARFYSISGPEIIDKFYGESEAQLRRIFTDAQRTAPSIIFIDEIDAIAPDRSDVYGQVEKRVVTQLLTLLDGIQSRGQVIVVGATNRPNALDPALRRPGRFDREIGLHAPDVNGRIEILRIHSVDMPLASDVDFSEIARVTPGFVGADLSALCREAAMAALRRTFPSVALLKGSISSEELLNLTVTLDDFYAALKTVSPSAAREVAVEISQTRWEEIGGLADAKRTLIETIEWPLRYPEQFALMNLEPVRGVLLSGPPGTGKTLVARALATACRANFISIKGPELLSKWVGESEKGVRELFARARQVAPCVLFLDEIDALAPARGTSFDSVSDRIIGQLLTELDGVEGRRGVIVVGATNRPELIDPAILRSGRFDLVLELPLPDRDARRAIYTIHMQHRPLAQSVSLDQLARRSDGLSGADIEAVCRRSANLALVEWLRSRAEPRNPAPAKPVIDMRHCERALAEIRQRMV